MGSVYGVRAWLLLAALYFAAWVWWGLGIVFPGVWTPDGYRGGGDSLVGLVLLLGWVGSLGMAGTWRQG